MAVTPNKVVLPQEIDNGSCSLVGTTPISSRVNISGTTGLTLLKGTTSNGLKVYEIRWKAQDTSSAGTVCVWKYDGTTSRLFDELQIAGIAVWPYSPSDGGKRVYDDLILLPTESLYCSVTTANDVNVFASAARF